VDFQEILEEAAARNEDPFLLILDGLEDPRNFGAILRTAECVGVHGVIIPNRRSVQVNETVDKTSTGAARLVKVAQVSNIAQVLEELKSRNIWITGLDMTGQDYRKIDYKGGVAIVIGGEGDGISRIVKEKCDFLAKIPMYGKIESLNASVAAAIVMYQVANLRFPLQ
jgi:23S rRNA (guanosine2251-2'-O)-methyltransferase